MELTLTYHRHAKNQYASKIVPYTIYFTELTFVLSGTLEYFINDEPITIEAGNALFAKYGSFRRRNASTEKVNYISFNFITDVEFDFPTIINGCIDNELKLLIMSYDEINKAYSPFNEEKNLQLLRQVLLCLQSKRPSQSYSPFVLSLIDYLHKNYTQKITMKDIGEKFFYSPQYCDRNFKRETGTSIIDFLLTFRIEESKNILLFSSIPLTGIPALVGFNDYNYFCRAFKKKTGMTPTQYKNTFPH